MVVRRHVSLLRRALGSHRWLVESELQRGYRIAPSAFHPQPDPGDRVCAWGDRGCGALAGQG